MNSYSEFFLRMLSLLQKTFCTESENSYTSKEFVEIVLNILLVVVSVVVVTAEVVVMVLVDVLSVV